jgi:hypothetical protein
VQGRGAVALDLLVELVDVGGGLARAGEVFLLDDAAAAGFVASVL